ncbi:MAG: OmpA family protein [Bacteroidota bacterium]
MFSLRRCAFLLLACSLAYPRLSAQIREDRTVLGAKVGVALSSAESGQKGSGYEGRGLLRHPIAPRVMGEIGVGFVELKGKNWKSQLVPLDYRLVFVPSRTPRVAPYLYAGAGIMYYEQERRPLAGGAVSRTSGRAGFIPAGAGLQFMFDNKVAVDINGGYQVTFADGLTSLAREKKGSYFNVLVGLMLVGDDEDEDPDRDGLKTKDERRLCSDPYNPDTDGDGLGDGEEVRTTKTSPCNPDTDEDGARDGDEVRTHGTDPLNPDTDGDRLLDGAEITTHKTDPLDPDTDGDSLTDGDEVLTHKTDPLDPDTDDGTVEDGVEVRRGTDPLNPADDVPRRETLTLEVGQGFVLQGVVFDFNKSTINPVSEGILTKALNTLLEYPDIVVEIHGHTDNKGTASYNLRLSKARAESVRAWLIARGIPPERIAGTKGFGFTQPIATNDTDEGRQLNRRIEFVRVR